ncbi:MAG: Zn-ribbon domain-containing OB-fold protein [Theionarchaea archaeon]|nr:Zn-ribbon domain-containing OB-fold protein [Theionarchaea archaeon]
MKKFAGERLSSEEMKEVTHEEWAPAVKYAWSCGEAMSRFLNELKKGKLIGRKCHKCKRVIFPPKMFCEFCFRPTDEWVYLPDTGTVMTYSLSYLDKDARRIEEPILVGVIAIDGASEHMGIMHYFSEMDPDDLDFGLKVKAVWKPEEEREGAVTDIKYFKPVEGEE